MCFTMCSHELYNACCSHPNPIYKTFNMLILCFTMTIPLLWYTTVNLIKTNSLCFVSASHAQSSWITFFKRVTCTEQGFVLKQVAAGILDSWGSGNQLSEGMSVSSYLADSASSTGIFLQSCDNIMLIHATQIRGVAEGGGGEVTQTTSNPPCLSKCSQKFPSLLYLPPLKKKKKVSFFVKWIIQTL